MYSLKKKRRELCNKRLYKIINSEKKEGITYQSNCGSQSIDFIDKPDPISLLTINTNTVVVFFYIETTGLKKTDQIVQIAAKANDKVFNVYILPTCTFTKQASTITGLAVHDCEMYLNSVHLSTVSSRNAIIAFISFLRSVSANVLLAAHNGSKFDIPRILQLIEELKMLDEFVSVVVDHIDTLTLLKSKLKQRKIEKKSFSLSALAIDYLGPSALVDAHNAVSNVTLLEKLINNEKINISNTDLINNGISIQSILNSEYDNLLYQNNLKSLQILTHCQKNTDSNNVKKGISMNMIKKIANAGINFEYLQ